MKTLTSQFCQPITEQAVNKALNKIISGLRPLKIILFGSYVKPKNEKPNDLDILIVMKSSIPFYKRVAQVKMLFNPAPFPMDVIIYTPEEFDKWRNTINHIIPEIIHNGKIVYERKQ